MDMLSSASVSDAYAAHRPAARIRAVRALLARILVAPAFLYRAVATME